MPPCLSFHLCPFPSLSHCATSLKCHHWIPQWEEIVTPVISKRGEHPLPPGVIFQPLNSHKRYRMRDWREGAASGQKGFN